MNIKKELKINSKIEIALVNDESNQSFASSLIQEVNSDSFSILVPIHKGHALYLAEDDEVVVSLLLNSVRYAFKTAVLGKKTEADINLVVLKNPDKITTSDRRSLVRIKTLLPAKYEILSNDNLDKWKNIIPTCDAYITDLSGKGLSLALNLPLLNQKLVLSINLDINGSKVQVKLLSQVIRCEKIDRGYRIGVEFTAITEKQQGLIINFVFNSLRKSIQLYKEEF